MSTVSFRMSDKENKLLKTYAEMHGISLSEFIREAVLEKIEDEHDLALFNKTWEDSKNQKKYSHDDVKKELGL